nr:hypothetical protein MarFTME_174 [Marseillevirus futianmevirus]
MEFSELPPEIQNYIFGFVGDVAPEVAIHSRVLYGVFLHNKEKSEKMSFDELVEAKNVFACSPKFSLSLLQVIKCRDSGYLLPLKSRIRSLKGTALVRLCKYIGEFLPFSGLEIPERGRKAFSFGAGHWRRSEKIQGVLFPEFICGCVCACMMSFHKKKMALPLVIQLTEELSERSDTERREALSKIWALLEFLGEEEFISLDKFWEEGEERKKATPEEMEDIFCLLK